MGSERHYPLVLVTWHDAAVFHGWKPIDHLTKVKTDKVESVGFLLQDNDEFIVLVMGLSENEDEEVVLGTETLAIPRQWLMKVEKLGLVEEADSGDAPDPVPALHEAAEEYKVVTGLKLDEHLRRGGTFENWPGSVKKPIRMVAVKQWDKDR